MMGTKAPSTKLQIAPNWGEFLLPRMGAVLLRGTQTGWRNEEQVMGEDTGIQDQKKSNSSSK